MGIQNLQIIVVMGIEVINLVKIFNECVGCEDLGLHCIGSNCPNLKVERYFCDECGDEEDLYWFDDNIRCAVPVQLCKECLLKHFEPVNNF